jgi:hypothetical protein
MPLLSEVKPATRIKALHVGRSGGGKTVAAASLAHFCPEEKSVYLFDNDGRIRPILKMHPELGERIEWNSYGASDFEKLYKKVGNIIDKPDKYWAVIMDGLTMLGDMTIDYSIDLRPPEAGNKTSKGVLEMPELQDYKAEMRGMSAILDELRSFPGHFIMTAHIMHVEYKRQVRKGNKSEEETKVDKLLVTAGRKIAAKIPIFFDEIYLFKPEVSHNLGTAPNFKAYTVPNQDFEECRSALSLPTEIDWTMKPGGTGFYERIMDEVKKNMPDRAKVLLEK